MCYNQAHLTQYALTVTRMRSKTKVPKQQVLFKLMLQQARTVQHELHAHLTLGK